MKMAITYLKKNVDFWQQKKINKLNKYLTNESVANALNADPNFFPSSDDKENEIEEAEEATELNERDAKIQEELQGAREFQKKQAEQMLEASNKRYSKVEVGQSVRILIDSVDRPKLGHHNLLAVVTDLNEEGQYKMGTKDEILPQRCTRNQFEPCSSNLLTLDDIPAAETSFHAAVGMESVVGTQGHKHCGCTGDCSTKRCACFKQEKICNSRCHNSNPCMNK